MNNFLSVQFSKGEVIQMAERQVWRYQKM